MRLHYLLTVFNPVFVTATCLTSSASPIINTTLGQLQGTTSPYRSDITVFKGIPYATPPTGSLRWKAPLPVTPWTGIKNASTFGAECAQMVSPTASIFGSANATVSEDCLYMNIWKPQNATGLSKLPVYVWIYGGRFTGGGGDVLTYDGSGLASKDIIVVTFNYRMGPFGFLAHPDLAAETATNSSGNYGLLDMMAALSWVQTNIAAFGGDSGRVTVGGQSAGSASALDMMYSPLSKNLIHGVIAESGARGPHDPETAGLATSYRQLSAAYDDGIALLTKLNVTSISELRNVSMAVLLTVDNDSDPLYANTRFANISSFMNPPAWRPVIDNYVLISSYAEALLSNSHADVPILTGNNADESGASPEPDLTLATYTSQFTTMFGNLSSTFFDLYPASNDTSANTLSNTLFRDLSRTSTWNWAKDWTAGGAASNVFTYYFTHAPPNQTAGVYHGAELNYVMNNLPNTNVVADWSAEDYAVEAVMSAYWANFIKTGDPNGEGLVEWPAMSNATRTMWLGDSWGAGEIAGSAEKVALLEEWFAGFEEW
ncbi:alpha/beta-Hydrolase [Glarea lozoyensis ATCC 20868]|uniref:Carboxylic ester hydrolase n=1 Tax=Glarea lozoyensis (strain ATCC 20868 / MF5171) TaxID=1116229 RepID=S3E4A7_GLAL2|nr:alpha/beta-Hydrolase [Glarea lozoyensis ATCC 20868]EPE33253.1 alpha/beta-Hydrolase [Glarea lozoyensis ATCC 20868]